VTEVDDGGAIIVAAGVYTGHVVIGKDLTLQGAGAGDTILDGEGTGRVLYVAGGHSVSISGVTIRNGSDNLGGGIRNYGALTLAYAAVTDRALALAFGADQPDDAETET